METQESNTFATLGHPGRLALLRLLIRRYPDHVAAGELAAALECPPSTLSAHLAGLMRVGLVRQERAGTSLRYAADMAALRGVFEFLFLDCCRGRPEICAPLGGVSTAWRKEMSEKYNVLFVCTGNSARSIFAEAILRKEAGARFNAYSAGTRPASELNPFALGLLRGKGHDVSMLRAKTVGEFRGDAAIRMDFVFTVCDRAANEECPPWEGQPVSAHWGMPDPVKAAGSDAERGLAFQAAYGALRNRIAAFAALPLETLDRISLQRAVDDIGRGVPA